MLTCTHARVFSQPKGSRDDVDDDVGGDDDDDRNDDDDADGTD